MAYPDIVAITRKVPWEKMRQWLDIVARGGTSLFVAPQPKSMNEEARAAMAIAARATSGYPLDSITTMTPRDWALAGPDQSH